MTVKLTTFGRVEKTSSVIRFGSEYLAQIQESGAEVRQDQFTVTTSAVKTLWLASDGPSTFSCLVIETDVEVVVEFVVDVGGEVGTVASTLTVVPEFPLTLGSPQAYAAYAKGFTGGTLDAIEAVRCQNLQGSTATVTVTVVE